MGFSLTAMQSIHFELIVYFHKINSTDLTFLPDTWNGYTCNTLRASIFHSN